ncbi:MAG: hypothetical protein HGA67_03925 [Candidatus Yonathbacteria bacterium]|nr:hypothetical protein [Candidatus Yonathbacteria bacterium]
MRTAQNTSGTLFSLPTAEEIDTFFMHEMMHDASIITQKEVVQKIFAYVGKHFLTEEHLATLKEQGFELEYEWSSTSQSPYLVWKFVKNSDKKKTIGWIRPDILYGETPQFCGRVLWRQHTHNTRDNQRGPEDHGDCSHVYFHPIETTTPAIPAGFCIDNNKP